MAVVMQTKRWNFVRANRVFFLARCATECPAHGGRAMVCAACGLQQGEPGRFCRSCGALMTAGENFAGAQPNPASAGSGPQAWMPIGQMPPVGAAPGSIPYGSGYGLPLLQQMQRGRVRQNLQSMGIAWCIWGVYRIVMGFVAAFAIHAIAHSSRWFGDGSEFVPGFLASFVPLIIGTSFVMAALALLTGYALLSAKSWGRPLAIVMAILSLIKIPLGTALGIYTLWVIVPRASGLEYEAIAQAEAMAA